jgi:hypothetical protein
MNVKRAYPVVVEKSDDLLFQVQNKISDIMSVQNSIDMKKKELVDNTNNIKQEMARAFEEIRLRFQKKEKEVMERAEIFLQEHLQEMNTYLRVLQSKVISLNKTIDNINSHITLRDEVSLLNFFSENRGRIIQTVETDLPDIPDFDSIYNMKVNINKNSFDSMVNSLNAIHVEITSINGYEVNKIQNQQKYAIKRDMYGAKNANNYDNKGFNNSNNKNIFNSNYANTTGGYSANNLSNDLNKNNNMVNYK